MRKRLLFLGLFLVPFMTMKAEATLGAGATYYLDLDAGANGDGTLGNPYNSIANAAAAQAGGNVFIIIDSTYVVGITSVPSGTRTMPTMIKAQTKIGRA